MMNTVLFILCNKHMFVSHITVLGWPHELKLYLNAIFMLMLTSLLCFFPTCSRILEGKEKDDPKTIPLKIFAKDIGNCAYVRSPSFLCDTLLLLSAQKWILFIRPSFCGSIKGITTGTYRQLDISIMFPKRFLLQAKTLAVSNSDSTTDVIRMALLQFGISVSKQRPLLLPSSI